MKLRTESSINVVSLFQLGIAVGFVLPPMLVGNHEDISLIGSNLKLMFYLVAGLTSVLVVLMVLCKFVLIFLLVSLFIIKGKIGKVKEFSKQNK